MFICRFLLYSISLSNWYGYALEPRRFRNPMGFESELGKELVAFIKKAIIR